jgi:Exo70 exocyst complex subunit
LDSEPDIRGTLARWTIEVIDTLVNIIETKSRAILRPKSSMAANLFILNNLSEIEKRARNDRALSSVVGSVGAAEKEKGRRTSRGSSGSSSTALFSMPKSFEKAKKAGLDGLLVSVLTNGRVFGWV